MSYHDDDDIVGTFLSELEDHIQVIESGILDIEKAGHIIDDDLIHTMFRSAHSIKASANLLEYKNIEAVAHKLENILQKIRNGEVRVNNKMVTIFLEGLDLIGELAGKLELSELANVTPVINKLREIAES